MPTLTGELEPIEQRYPQLIVCHAVNHLTDRMLARKLDPSSVLGALQLFTDLWPTRATHDPIYGAVTPQYLGTVRTERRASNVLPPRPRQTAI